MGTESLETIRKTKLSELRGLGLGGDGASFAERVLFVCPNETRLRHLVELAEELSVPATGTVLDTTRTQLRLTSGWHIAHHANRPLWFPGDPHANARAS